MKLILGHFYSYMLAFKSSSYMFLFMLLYVLCAQPLQAADLPNVIREHSNVSAKVVVPVKPRVEAGRVLQSTSVDTDAFISIWEVFSANPSITIPAVGEGFYFSVAWEKEDNPAIAGGKFGQTQSLSISFPEAGRYRVKITGDYPHFLLNSYESRARFREVAQWGSISWKSMKGSFSNIPRLLFTASDAPDLSQVKDMSMMFKSSPDFNGDLSSWNVSKVTNMSEMFNQAKAFNHSLNSWNVSNVTGMSKMFNEAVSFNQPLNAWNVSNVTDMSKMFNEAVSFNQPLNAWNVSNVTDMSEMFMQAKAFNHSLNSWNVSNVTGMSKMFKEAVSFNQPLNSWNVSKVTNMSKMFNEAVAFNQLLNAWNVSNVTDMSEMFHMATVFNQPLNDWDVSAVKKFDLMFSTASAFDSSLDNWKPGVLAPDGCSMVGVFINSNFNQDLSSWDVSNVRNMQNFFRFTLKFNQDISSWDVSNVTNMNFMFWWSEAFNQDLGAWNISSVKELEQIFVNSKLSTANYDKTLIGWAALGNALQKDVILESNRLTWCMSESARDYLENVKYWTIKNDVQKCEELTPSKIIYVKKNATGNGNGLTWSNAYKELGDALAWAAAQTNPSWTEAAPLHIYVSKGVYKPTKVLVSKDMEGKPTTNRDKSFLLVKNVQVFGGFNGDDNLSDLNQRSFQSNNSHEQQHTFLTGRFNDNVEDENNAHHVVVALEDLGVAKLDGLSIRAGRADGLTNLLVLGKEIPRSSGAGLYLDGASLLMENVVVEDNLVQGKTLSNTQGNGRPLEKSVYGGGLYARDANLNFKNVIFQNNRAGFSVDHPSFKSFSAEGAGVYLSNSTSDFYGVSLLNNVIDFSSNNELPYSASGAGLFNSQGNLNMRKSRIENNKVVVGAFSTSSSRINAAGAGMYANTGQIGLTEMQFKNNKITASAISAAEFSLMGAGMYNAGKKTSLKNVDFIGNSIEFDSYKYQFKIYRANAAGLYNYNSVVDLVQVKLVGNKVSAPIRLGSEAYGAAMFNSGSSPVLINCLVNQNTAASYAGGIYNTAGSNPKIYNTILFGNKVGEKEENITNSTALPKSTPEFKHSFVGGAYVWDTAWGANIAGNIVSQNNPFDTNNTDGNYSLTRCSEVVNAGLNELFPELKSNSLDRAGKPRVYMQAGVSKIDMGPFEFQQAAIDFSAVKMLPAEYTYDGKGKTIKATGLPYGISASYEIKDAADNRVTEAKEAGVYKVIATLDGCTPNRVLAPVTLTINKVPLTITARAPSKVYDADPYQGPVSLYYDGFVNDEDERVLGGTLSYAGSGKDVVDVGSYEILPVGLTADNYEITVVAATFNISKADLGFLEFQGASYVYDGLAKSVEIGRLPLLDVLPVYVGNGQTEAGTHTVTASISNARNYEDWSASTTLSIAKAPITGIDFKDASDVYDGRTKALSYADVLPAGVTVKGYSNNENTEVGEYTVILNLDGGNNYEDLSLSATLRIAKAPITGINFEGASHVYDGTKKSLSFTDRLPVGVSVKEYVNNGHTDVGDYTVMLKLAGGPNYEDFQTTAMLSITKAKSTTIVFESNDFVYDGSPKSLAIKGELPAGVTIKDFDNNLHTDVGIYNVTLKIFGGHNYEDFNINAALNITKAVLKDIDFTSSSYVYDGLAKSVEIGRLPLLDVLPVYVGNGQTEAGTHTVTASISNARNYEDWSASTTLRITKAPLTGIDFKDASHVYDGRTKALSYADVLPAGVTVKGYSNNKHTEVGEYTVTLNLDGGDNYEDLSLSARLVIIKALMERFDFPAVSFVYDGKPKSLLFKDKLPAGATVESYANNQQTEVGTYTVTAFIKGGRNYTDYQQSAQLTITKAILTGLDLKDATLEYDGKAKSLVLTGKLPVGVSIKQYLGNAQTETGTYTVHVELDGGNNYEPWTKSAVMTIHPFKQVLSFGKISPVGRDAGLLALDLRSNSPLPIQVYSDNQLVATVSGETELTILGVGMSNIRAEQAGNKNYTQAIAVEQVLEVLHKQGAKLPVYLHQAVSPNGDGINDFLRIEGIEIYPENKLAIYDANGALLKEIVSYNNTTNNFEGIRTGGVVRNGTYFYVLSVKVAGKWMHDKGFFVIKE